MNILPKKSWHVRTKKNIARVRKDEAKAAEEEKEIQRKIALAGQEARTALLRERASKRLAGAASTASVVSEDVPETAGNPSQDTSEKTAEGAELRFGLPLGSLKDVVQPDGHVNFFQDVEAGKRQGGVNDEHEEEQRKEQEDYEKKIGYLVYLGQDSLEHSKAQPWYSKIDRGKGVGLEGEIEKVQELDRAAGKIGGLEEKSKTASVEEIKMTKFKSFLDPLKDIRKYLSTPGVKKKMADLPTSNALKRKRDLKGEDSSVSSAPIKRKRIESPDQSHKNDKHKNHKRSKSSKKSKKHRKSSKHKKRSKSSSSDGESYSESSNDDSKKSKLEKLRAERLEREREERRKAEKVLAKRRGETVGDDVTPQVSNSDKTEKSDYSATSMSRVKQKYNSQFNPHLARQNYD